MYADINERPSARFVHLGKPRSPAWNPLAAKPAGLHVIDFAEGPLLYLFLHLQIQRLPAHLMSHHQHLVRLPVSSNDRFG
ncbi:hypothetical protein D3C73_1505340 [compost metagenome]